MLVRMKTPSSKLWVQSALLFATLLWTCSGPHVRAQVTPGEPSVPVNLDKVDARAYAVLFRRVNTYQKMSQAAASPDKPEAHLSNVLPLRFKLSEYDASSLRRVSAAWADEMVPLRAQIVATVAQFRNSFPGGIVRQGMDPTPPASLGKLQEQVDRVTLRYRDALRNEMRRTDFDRLQTQIRETFSPKVLAGNLSSPIQVTDKEVVR